MRTGRAKPLLKSKIKNLNELSRIAAKRKARGERIVFTNGCFDILHYGHVKYLQDARNKGDALVVGINRDCSVKKIKGSKRPIVNEKDRAGIVAALESVDYVVLFAENTPFKLIQRLKPDILVKGADWGMKNIVGKALVLSYGGKVRTIKLAPGRSTTRMIKKIASLYAE